MKSKRYLYGLMGLLSIRVYWHFHRSEVFFAFFAFAVDF